MTSTGDGSFADNVPGVEADVQNIQSAAHLLDPTNPARIRDFILVLDQYSALLARADQTRQNLGNANSPSIWPILGHLWDLTSSAHMLPSSEPGLAPALAHLSASLAKFTRNLVAACPSNQQRAFANESTIRKLIYHYTSYSETQNAVSYPATRMLVQALSNIVTGNDPLSQELWSIYLAIPEEQLILTRLFSSPDARTVSSAFVLVLNCIHGSAHRTEMLTGSPRGPRICLVLLDRIASLFDAEDSSEEGRAFDIGYEIFTRIIEHGLAPNLYGKLAVEGEPIVPHQTTLLKLLDSYLHSSERDDGRYPGQPIPEHDGTSSLLDMLVYGFVALSSHAQTSIQSALGSQATAPAGTTAADHPSPARGDATSVPQTETMSTDPPRVPLTVQEDGPASLPLQELDLLLPKVCEALVLVTECLTTIALRAEEAAQATTTACPIPPASSSPKSVMVNARTSAGEGFVECLIETLRRVDVFVPRITYGKVLQRPAPQGQPEFQGAPNTSDSDSMTGSESLRGEMTPDPKHIQAAQAFAHVKRNLVRLLGVLASQDRDVQDTVRECGGLPVIMNLCVVDDYNPYLREHAIFALRNLLHGNLESQAVVDAIKPVGRWDESKVLQEF